MVGDISPKDDNLLSAVVSVASVLGLLIFIVCLVYPFPVYVEASGVVERMPADAVLSSPASGTLVSLYVKDGQEVAEGAIVACIRPSARQAGASFQLAMCPHGAENAFSLSSPTNGTVTLSSLREADQVEAKQPVLSIEHPQARLVGVVRIDPQKASAIEPEAHATIWTAASPLSRSSGIEAKVAGKTVDLGKDDSQPLTRYTIRLKVAEDQQHLLLPGAPFRARIFVGSRPLYRYILPGRSGA